MFTNKLTFLMNISIKNLGIIQSAEIELNGLTVLTGLNDSGKSFIGKLIFSIIKTINEAEWYYQEKKIHTLTDTVTAIIESHRKSVPFNPERINKFNYGLLNDKVLDCVIHNKDSALLEQNLSFIKDYEKKII